jgi:hypothetical protein
MKYDYYDLITVIIIFSAIFHFLLEKNFDLTLIAVFILDLKVCQMIYNES